jgi:hypothetical protein
MKALESENLLDEMMSLSREWHLKNEVTIRIIYLAIGWDQKSK